MASTPPCPSLPPPSIAVDTLAILSQVEHAKVRLVLPLLEQDVKVQQSSDGLKYLAVTELAAHLYLGNYTMARHVWRRYRHDDDDDGLEMIQFRKLWNVAQFMMMSSRHAQVYETLNDCIHHPEQQPLARYAEELYEAYRLRNMTFLLRSGVYCKISFESCMSRFGLLNAEDATEYLTEWGWIDRGNGFWTPPSSRRRRRAEIIPLGGETQKNDDKIQTLTEIVSFMERKKMNA